MIQDSAIKLNNVSLSYKTESSHSTLKDFVINLKKKNRSKQATNFQIDDISLEINRGEIVGIVGTNGSGKSTFLKLLAGVLIPDRGSIQLNLSKIALVDLNAGLHPDLNAIDNIFLTGAMYGMSRKGLSESAIEVLESAGIDKNENIPIHSLSTGLQARLGFASAFIAQPELLLIDETLSVSDHRFLEESKKRLRDLQNLGSVIILASHDLNLIGSICSKVIWIKQGQIFESGITERILEKYRVSITQN